MTQAHVATRPHRDAGTAARAPGFARTAQVGGSLAALVGVVVMLSWWLHITAVLVPQAAYSPMVVNSALALAVTGTATVLAVRGRTGPLLVAGALDLGLGLVVLTNPWLGWATRVNELLARDYLAEAGRTAGLMAPNTAVCLVALGVAVLLWTSGPRQARTVSLLCGAAVVGGTAMVAVFGYLAGLPSAYGWSGAVSMAPLTAVTMGVLALALACLAQTGSDTARQAPVSEWVALPAGMAAFVVAGLLWRILVEGSSPGARVQMSTVSHAVLLLVVVNSASLGLTTWSAQHAHRRRHQSAVLAATLAQEVARRRQAEAVAQDGERRLTAVLDALPVGVIVAGPGPSIHFVNDRARRMLARGVEPLERPDDLAEPYEMTVSGTDDPYPPERSPLLRALAGESSHADDAQIGPPGARRQVEVWGTPLRGKDGRVELGLSVFTDITQRRLTERRLAERASLLNLSRDAIMVCDSVGAVVYWNHGAALRYGWSPGEAVGCDVMALLRTELPVPLRTVDSAVAESGHWQGEAVQHTRSGERVDVLSQWVAHTGPDATGAMLRIDTDISLLKLAEAELRRRSAALEKVNRELQRSNDDLTQFAYAASHDLAEPLRAISGPVSLLARRYRGRLDDDADVFIDFAVDGCERMQNLIDDLLTFSRVGRVDADKEPVDVARAVSTVLAVLRPTLDDCGATVTVGDLPAMTASAGEIQQVLQNLVSNAVKFRAPGVRPEVGISAIRQAGFWRVSVTDNGIGIAPRHRERVFGMFKRLHSREDYPGTGIGLALAKKIVERHGGEIGVLEGPSGVGSTFWFTLPGEEKVA